jgi:hypothetical protein
MSISINEINNIFELKILIQNVYKLSNTILNIDLIKIQKYTFNKSFCDNLVCSFKMHVPTKMIKISL